MRNDFQDVTEHPTPRQTAEALYEYMLQHQAEHHKPPTLEEIATALETLNYRSSALAAIQRAVDLGLVTVDDEEGHSRRYSAIPRQEIEDRFNPTWITVPTEALWPDD